MTGGDLRGDSACGPKPRWPRAGQMPIAASQKRCGPERVVSHRFTAASDPFAP